MKTISSSGDRAIPLTVGVNFYARVGLSAMRQGERFVDMAVERGDTPPVAWGVRHELWRIEPLLVAVWELQTDGRMRWHLMRHWSFSRLDTPTHFMLLSNMGEYVPLDWRVVEMVRLAKVASYDPVGFVEKFYDEQVGEHRLARITRDGVQPVNSAEASSGPAFIGDDPVVGADEYDRANEVKKYYQRLFKRAKWGSVGSCWERGSELPWLDTVMGSEVTLGTGG